MCIWEMMKNVYQNINLDSIGEDARNLRVASEYCERLARKFGNLKDGCIDKLDTSKNLWANQDFIDSIGRVAEERRHGRSIPGTF